MIYALYGLIFGLLIPYFARRFSKFMPATPGYALYRIIKPNKSVNRAKKKTNPQYIKLMNKYLMRSIGWGIVTSALSYLAVERFGLEHICWYLSFIWILLLLTEIDNRMFLLPDILTIPLLLLGFAFAVFFGIWATPVESVIGALGGYIVPVFASLFLVWKNKDVFGGGDIKLLTALGAWLGLELLMYVIVLSCIIFGVYALMKRKRAGAFGPALATAAIMIAFYFF